MSLGIIYKCGGRGGIYEPKLNARNFEVLKEESGEIIF